jgi:pilus assembly protein CpaE
MTEDTRQKTRIVLTEPQPGAADELQARLTGEAALAVQQTSVVEIVGYARDGLEAAQMATQLTPDVILVHEELPGMDGYEACEMMSLAAPNVASVLLVDHSRLGNENVNRRALRAGARAVLALDSPTEVLLETLASLSELTERRQRPEYELITDPMKMPVTIAITGAKGGIGKTTLAANLAVSFARRFHGEVLLVDFYGQYGNVPLMLNLSANGNIGELATFAAELDINIIENHLVQHQDSTLKVLPGFPDLIDSRLPEVTGRDEIAFVADLIGLLRRHYRFVFFDVPPLVGRASAYIFSRCQYILLVSSLFDLNTVRDTATLYQQLTELHIAPEHIKLLVNRSSRGTEFSIKDLEQATGAKVAFELPDDPAAAVASINEGVPCVVSRPGSSLSRSVGQLTEMLVGELAEMVLASTP